MNSSLPEKLVKTMEDIPPKAIFVLAKIERKMIENDVANKRLLPTGEAASVLSFCRFLESPDGRDVPPIQLPVAHIAAYRKIVQKLIDAGEFSSFIKERFDQIFCSNLLQDLAV